MTDTILEEIIKTVYGANWLIPAVIILAVATVIGFVYKSSLPEYVKACLSMAASFVSLLLLSLCYPWANKPNLLPMVVRIQCGIAFIAAISITTLMFIYRKIDKQLSIVINNTESGGNRITAWKELQNIKVSRLTPLQKKKYVKRRLYLRVFLGNTSGA